MRVLIADDEIKVCQLITHLVDWQSLGFEIAGVVNDGKAAYQFICDNKPDIVITDIRMPNYDGIELVRRAKELYPEMHFIIISGYSHFEYAQSAIKYGVEDYLLKPLKKRNSKER
ncbi:MAG TPA: response regulator [Clostridia bacterium]